LHVFSGAGATATGSHGSGTDLGGCASAISGVEIITASGETLALRRDRDEDFLAAPVNLGALGIVSALTLDTVPTFDITEYEYEGIPEPTFIENLEEIFASGYSVSVFTNWQGTTFDSARVKCLGGSPPMPEEWMGARWSRVPRIPRQGVVGPWCSRLPHEEAAPTRKGTQTEYFVPRALAREAIEEMIGLARLLGPVLRTSEIRTIAADDLWLSPCYRRDSLSIHFTWKEEMTDQPERLAPVLATIESALAPFGARPHWGKLFSTAPEVLADLYEQMSAFGDLGRAHDPSGKFTNAFLERTLGLRS
jgi:xylitol oxidase